MSEFPVDLAVIALHLQGKGYKVETINKEARNDVFASYLEVRTLRVRHSHGYSWISHNLEQHWHLSHWPTERHITIDPAFPDAIERLEDALVELNKYQSLR